MATVADATELDIAPDIAPPVTLRAPPKREFLAHVHSFRAFAIIAVVIVHMSSGLDWQHVSDAWRPVLLSLIQNATVSFVFIAGFLFQYLIDRYRYPTYLSSKLKHVVVPYLVVSMPVLVYQYLQHSGIFAPNDTSHTPLRQVVQALATGEHMPMPLWFIPMIVVFYVLAPLFVWIDRHPSSYWVTFPIALVVASFAHRPMPVTAPLHGFVYFLPAYLAGMWVSHHRDQVFVFLSLRWTRWLLFGAFAMLLLIETAILGGGGALFSETPFGKVLFVERTWHGFDLNLTAKLVLSVLVLALLADASERFHRRADFLAAASFGVFFLHMYVLRLLVRVFGGPLPADLLTLVALTIVVLALTAGLIIITRRLTGRWSRMLIGC